MIVGTHGTGEGRYGPEPSGRGTHEGTDRISPDGDTHGAVLLLSHPQSFQPWPTAEPFLGLSPVKPSVCAAARPRWLPQLDESPVSKVRSEMVKARASPARLGIWLGWYSM